MTAKAGQDLRHGRPRGALMARTALCGALAGLSAILAQPAAAQSLPGTAPPGLVLGGLTAVSAGGGAPSIAITGGSATVALHAPRTVIDWSSFNLGGDQTATFNFDARSWIVLNRIQDINPATISGRVAGLVNGSYGGNIWFSSRSGIIFGSGAQIDAGGILATASAPDLTQFLNPQTTAFDFSGDSIIRDGQIQIQAGAQLTGHGGLVALIAPNVASDAGSAVNGQGGSNVLYGAAEGYQIHLAQGATGDLDLVDFIIPDAASGSRTGIGLDLQNTTTANSVFVAAVSRTGVASAVINLEGMITAQAAVADGGDIILSGGGGIVGRTAGPTVSGARSTELYLRNLNASRDIVLNTNGLTLAIPWPRPPKVVLPAPPAPVDTSPGQGSVTNLPNDNSPHTTPGTAQGAHAPLLAAANVETPTPIADVNSGFLSKLTAGRDIRLTSTQEIDLGAGTAGRDVTVNAGSLQANALSAGGATSLKTGLGGMHLGLLTFRGDTTLVSSGSAEVDAVGFAQGPSQTLTVQAGGNAILGDGSGDVGGGVINLTAGANAIVNLGGSAKVNSVTAGGSAILEAGALTVGAVKAQQILAKGGSVTVTQATATGDVYVVSTGGDATLANATAGDDVYVQATGGTASLTNAALTGLGADQVGAGFAGNPDTAGNGRVISVQSTDLDARLGLGTGVLSGATLVNVKAGQDATVDLPGALSGALSVASGRDATLRAPTVSFDAVTAGRDLTLTATGGDMASSKSLTAVRNITVNASGALTVADITADAGSITLTGKSVTAGALTAGQDLTLKASGGGVQLASYKVGRDLVVQGASLNLGSAISTIGRDLSITTPGDFTSASDIVAGRNITLDVQGKATTHGLSGADVHVIAGDFDLGGALTATTVEIESRSGALKVGGAPGDAAPASGLWFDNAEFGRVHATTSVSLYAGATAGGPRGDLTVGTLDVNPASTPLVSVLAGGGHNVLVQGVVAPTAPGGAVRIGDAASADWRPTQILISGAIGAATFSNGNYSSVRDFTDVRLHATDDIIMGSQRFIGLIQAAAPADIELGRNRPAGVAATAAEQNKVFVSAGRLELSANGKVVNQNTSPSVAQSVGIFLTSKSSPSLVIDPPILIDIYGTYIDASGHPVSSFAAGGGVSYVIVDANGNPTTAPVGAIYRFNSCVVGTSQCSAATQLTANLAQNNPTLAPPITGAAAAAVEPQGDAGAESSSNGPAGSSGSKAAAQRTANNRNAPPPLLAAAPSDPQAALADPVVTGAGSEEIWRKSGVKP